MIAVLPMLTENCRSIEQAMQRFPNGMYCEMNYGGERIHVHKKDMNLQYYSHTFKPEFVKQIVDLKQLIFQAFPYTKELILDCEILPFNIKNSNLLLPYTTEIQQNSDLKEIHFCLLIIDCMYSDGDISRKSLRERREIIKSTMIEIPNVVMLSVAKEVSQVEDFNEIIPNMLNLGLDGFILKDIDGAYEPGKRLWLKIGRNCFSDDDTAVSVNLLALGAWYGAGKYSGVMSIFLMGCYNHEEQCFCTVAKVYTDNDKKGEHFIERMNMIEINCDYSKLPNWLCCTSDMVPDLVAKNPQAQPVWKITAMEFLKDSAHSASGISLRFPQITKFEHDKNWKQALDLAGLKKLYEDSKIEVLTKNRDDVASLKNFMRDKWGAKLENEPAAKRKTKISCSASPKKKLKKNEIVINSLIQKPKVSLSEHLILNAGRPFPNYFENVFLLLDEEVKNRHTQWIRCFVACGGTLVHDYQQDYATHVLHLYDEEPEEKMYRLNKVVHIIVEWIKDSFKKGVLQDDRPYRVRLISKKQLTRSNTID